MSNLVPNVMQSAWRRLDPPTLTAWLPNACAVCRSGTRGALGRICADCRTRFAPLQPRCALCAQHLPAGACVCGACLKAPPPWRAAVAACDYVHPWDGQLQAFKFHDALDLAPTLSQMLLVALSDRGPCAVDVLLPVPLSAQRLRERGYNQAAVLATALGRQLDRPSQPGWLLRLIDTPHQLALPRTERLANVRGAFAVEPLALARIAGRRVALIDDVMTTGATAAEITRVLLQAGAASVDVWVVARTP